MSGVMYRLKPEVPGSWAGRTVVTNRREVEAGGDRNPGLINLDYRFDGWMGDSLLTSYPVFIVTEELAADMHRQRLSGVTFDNVEVSVSEELLYFYPDVQLPPFRWLVPTGSVTIVDNHIVQWSGHDVCIDEVCDLFVTETCMKVLGNHPLNYCEIEEIWID
jgi:hypothetical protein